MRWIWRRRLKDECTSARLWERSRGRSLLPEPMAMPTSAALRAWHLGQYTAHYLMDLDAPEHRLYRPQPLPRCIAR